MGKKIMIILTVLMITLGIMFFVGVFSDLSGRFELLSDPNAGTLGSDIDHDGIGDSDDNCPIDKNANQTDSDADGVGDECELKEGVI